MANSMSQYVQNGITYIIDDPTIAPVFVESTAYSAGQYVKHEGNLYKLTAAHAANTTWANTSKTPVLVESELRTMQGETNELKSAIQSIDNNFSNSIVPLYNPFPNANKILGSSGQLNDNTSFSTSDYLDATASTRYFLQRDSGNAVVCSYATDKSFISNSQQIINSTVNNFTTPANTAFIRISVVNESTGNVIVCPFFDGYEIYGIDAFKIVKNTGRFDNVSNSCNLITRVIPGGYISAVDGSFVASTSFAYSPLVKVAGHKQLAVTSGQSFLSFYNSSKTIIPGTNVSYTDDMTRVDVPANAEYFRICVKTENMTDFEDGKVGVYYFNDYVIKTNAGLSNLPRFDNQHSNANCIGAMHRGAFYKGTDGGRENSQDWYYSDLIPLHGVDTITLSAKLSFLGWYDSSKTIIPGENKAYTADTVVKAPANAEYFRICMNIANIDYFNDGQIYAILGDAITVNPVIHVGTGYEFTTLRSAFEYAFSKENVTVYVHPGTYDLVTEYADKISTFTGDAGLYIGHGMHVIFYDGAKVTANFDVSGYTAEQKLWALIHFQPIFTHGSDFVIEGLDIEATDTRYCIHDELVGTGTYVHKYFNCRMKYARTYSTGQENNLTQCIGGGLGLHGTIVIDGGYYKSVRPNGQETNDQICISYHNGNAEGCDSSVFIKNVYLADRGFFQFGCYGPTQDKSQVYISGCGYALPPNSGLQNSTAQYYNMEITTFANEQRVTGVHWEFDETEPWKYELVND